jgi:sulfatase maturation enzyme AslB (radical SAM superfamily)
MPWHALTLTGGGDIKPCCQLKGAQGNIHRGETFAQTLDGENARRLRREFLAGRRPAECSSCWTREASIGESRRTWFARKFGEALPANAVYDEESVGELLQVDLNLSNFCNLKCRMCGSWASHQWNEDDRALSAVDRRFKRENRPERLRLFETAPARVQELLPKLRSVRRIDFKGGEPMLAKAHPELLEMLIANGLHTKASLHYTSNGTVLNPRVLELLAKFRKVSIVFSIEAVGPLYRYIRGGRYDVADLAHNIARYDELENVSLGFNVATQIYNVTRLRELHDFLFSLDLKRGSARDAFKYTMVNDPGYLSPFILPNALREKALAGTHGLEELQSIHHRLEQTAFHRELWDIFKSFTSELDRRRGESILDVLPEFAPHWETAHV